MTIIEIEWKNSLANDLDSSYNFARAYSGSSVRRNDHLNDAYAVDRIVLLHLSSYAEANSLLHFLK